MTTFLDRPRLETSSLSPDDTIDTIPLPVIDINDGYGTGLKLTEAIDTLASEAEEIGIPYDNDGTLQIGDIKGDHIVIEQELVNSEKDGSASVISTIDIAAPSKNTFFRFRSQVRGDLIEFSVTEESPGVSEHGEFSGKSGSELPASAIKPTQHLTETMIQVIDALCMEEQISGDARRGVVEHLNTHETVQHDQFTRVMGSTALGKLLTNLGLYRSARAA